MSGPGKLNPALAMQMNVKQNAQELNAYLKDLQSWSGSVKQKDEALKSGSLVLSKPAATLPPIRGSSGSKAAPVLLPSSASADEVRFAEAKAAGNAAFSAGRFEESLTHYSQAMLLNPRDAIIPSNRAQALLKLQRWHEAEVDASTALSIDAGQVKALFRRAQARRQLRKYAAALGDCHAVEKLDPSNKPAKALGVEVAALLQKQQEARAKASQPIVSSTPVVPTTSATTAAPAAGAPAAGARRMVIQEESDDEDEEEAVPIKKAAAAASAPAPAPAAASNAATPATVSTPPAAAAAAPAPATQPVPVAQPAAAAAAAASVSSTTASTTSSPSPAAPASPSASSSSSSLRVPSTAYEFDSTFRSLRNDPAQVAAFLRILPLKQFPTLLKTALDSTMLKATVQALVEVMLPAGDLSSALTVLEGLSTVARFNVARLMLGVADKQALQTLFQAMHAQPEAAGASKEHIAGIAALYSVKL